jgi:hypothetical protein
MTTPFPAVPTPVALCAPSDGPMNPVSVTTAPVLSVVPVFVKPSHAMLPAKMLSVAMGLRERFGA